MTRRTPAPEENVAPQGSPVPGLTLTPRAAQAVLERARDAEVQGHLLKVAVVSGGCNGLAWELYFVEAEAVGDRVFTAEGVRMAVDPTSFPLLEGTVIDLADGRPPTFRFLNPRARKHCSCGASFEV